MKQEETAVAEQESRGVPLPDFEKSQQTANCALREWYIGRVGQDMEIFVERGSLADLMLLHDVLGTWAMFATPDGGQSVLAGAMAELFGAAFEKESG